MRIGVTGLFGGLARVQGHFRSVHIHSAGARFSHTVCIVGSGPAGFYTAYRLLETNTQCQVHMLEKLPVPYGLARFGVAPDHPEVKNCQDKFAEVAASPRFHFAGGVTVGQDVTVADLRNKYDALVLAYGASEDKRLGIPGEDLPGVLSAREFVAWYNGLPGYANLNPPLSLAEHVTIIGNGNVALDVARILLCDLSHLRSTDITEHAYESLKKSTVRHVSIVARRGILQSAFTTKEIRELTKTAPMVSLSESLGQYLPFKNQLKRPVKRMLEVLEKASTSTVDADKRFELKYLLSPTQFLASPSHPDLLSAVRMRRNLLEQPSLDEPARAVPTEETELHQADLAFTSVGYQSEPLEGIPFERGIVPNKNGRVNGLDRVYAVGWVKNGPTGVIADTMADAFDVAQVVLSDLEGQSAKERPIPSSGVTWSDWEKIDTAESLRGQAHGKPREKFVTVEEMLAAGR